MSEADQLILQQLKSLGADIHKPREVIHYLYLPTRKAAHQAADALRLKGYLAEEQMAADAKENPPNPFLVLARNEIVVTPQATHEFRRLFEHLAKFHNGEYDGWEAAVKP
jgi:hypothetical protein